MHMHLCEKSREGSPPWHFTARVHYVCHQSEIHCCSKLKSLLYVYCSMFLFIFPQRLRLVFSTQQYWESPHQSECHTVLMTLLQPLSLQNNIPKRLTFRNRLIFLFCLCFLSCVPAKDKPIQISFVLDPYGSVSTLSITKRKSTLVCKLEL